jgi:hypothetical protein
VYFCVQVNPNLPGLKGFAYRFDHNHVGTTLHILLVPLPRRRADEEIRRHIKRYMEALAKALDLLEPQQLEQVMKKIAKNKSGSPQHDEQDMFDEYRHKKRVQFNGGQTQRRPMNGANGTATQSANATTMPDPATQTTERAATEEEKQPTPRRVSVQEEAPAETNAPSTSGPTPLRVGVSLRGKSTADAIPVDVSGGGKLMPPKPKTVAPTADPDKELKDILAKTLLRSSDEQIQALIEQARPLVDARIKNAVQHYQQQVAPAFFTECKLIFWRYAMVATCHMMYRFTLENGRQASPGYKTLLAWIDKILSKFEPTLEAMVAKRRLEFLDRLARFDKLYFALDLQMWLARCRMGQESEEDLVQSAQKLVDVIDSHHRSVVLMNLAEHMHEGIQTKASQQLAIRLGWRPPEEPDPLPRVAELYKRLKSRTYNKESTAEWLKSAKEALKDSVELLVIEETDVGRRSARGELEAAQSDVAEARAKWLAEHTALTDRDLLKWAGYGLMIVDLLQIKPEFKGATSRGKTLLQGIIAQDIDSKKDAADRIVSTTNWRVHDALKSAREENSILVATFCLLDYAIRTTINSGKDAPHEVFPPRRLWTEDLMGAKLPHGRVLVMPALEAIEEDYSHATSASVQAQLELYFDYLAERVGWRSTNNDDDKLVLAAIRLRMTGHARRTKRLAAVPEESKADTDPTTQPPLNETAAPLNPKKKTLRPSKTQLEMSSNPSTDRLPVYDKHGDPIVHSEKVDGKDREVKEQENEQPSGLLSQFEQEWGSSTGSQQGSPGYLEGMQYYPSSSSEEASPVDIDVSAYEDGTPPSSSSPGLYDSAMQFDTGTVFFTDRDYTKHSTNVEHRQKQDKFWSKLTFEEAEILSRPINWVLLPYCTMGGAPAPIIAHTNPICGHYGSDWVVRSLFPFALSRCACFCKKKSHV